MSEFKIGDKVLVEATVLHNVHPCIVRVLGDADKSCATEIHPHPGVPVADLAEAFDDLLEWGRRFAVGCTIPATAKAVAAAREAAKEPEGITGVVLGMALMMGRDANEWLEILDYARRAGWTPKKPKLEEGQEVWVRGVVAGAYIETCGVALHVDNDDIRTEEP